MQTKRMIRGTCAMLLSAIMLAGCAHAGQGSAEAGKQSVRYDKAGFFTKVDNERLWVFRDGSPEHQEFVEKGKPAKHVVRPGAGPGGITVRAVDSETIIEYVSAQDSFYTKLDKNGRLWVFKADSEDLKSFKEKGDPAKHVVRPGVGPMGLTLKAVDTETIDAYLAQF